MCPLTDVPFFICSWDENRPSKVLASQEDTLIKLQQQLEKLEALLQDKDDADAR